jgi:hypothetical protein
VQEVRRAVEWIDDPQVLGIGIAAAARALLGEDGVLRIDGMDRLDDRCLGRAVDLWRSRSEGRGRGRRA